MPSPAAAPVPHRLTDVDLSSLASGRFTAAVIGRLTAAERSKHRLLVEAVRRRAERSRPPRDLVVLNSAMRLLGEIETHAPDVVGNLLALPQIGSWAIGCLQRMADRDDDDEVRAGQRGPLDSDLGYLAAIAAAAALRAGHRFELRVPLRQGTLLLPGWGMARLDCGCAWGTVRVRFDGEGAMTFLRSGTVVLPTGSNPAPSGLGPRWSPIPRLRVRADGLELDVMLDAFDPFLARVGGPASALSAIERTAWRFQFEEAWRILVRHHRAAAAAFAAVVSTVVPLSGTALQPGSATSGWAFGAIGLSPPDDGVSLAETFVHELHHLVLGAVEDLVPLVARYQDGTMGYAPWRDDPRPVAGVLHGCYAYLGVTSFWRRQRRIGVSSQRLRGAVEFARWRQATLDTATTLTASPALTDVGRRFAAGIRQQLAAWRRDVVPPQAELFAAEVRTEHRVRWRLTHLRPAAASIQALASAWMLGAPAPLGEAGVGGAVGSAPAAPVQPPGSEPPGPSEPPAPEGPPPGRSPQPGHTRAYLLEARYRDPSRLSLLLDVGPAVSDPAGTPRSVSEGDAALLRGDDMTATHCYLRRLEAADDADAWAGLAVVLRRSGPSRSASLLTRRPEVAAALCARLRALRGQAPDVWRLLDWLAG